MTDIKRPDIECELEHASLRAPDINAAIEFYTTKLGFKLDFTWGGEPPTMCGLSIGNVQMFIEKGEPQPRGASVYFVVGNVDEVYEFHRAGGVEITEPVADREYGIRDYTLKDLNGYGLGFGQQIWSVGEPIPIERVDMPVRLEKRLAALLTDLATAKRMSLSALFEETFLHTLDGVEPHTKGQLAKIQELKQKHGIDYDSHGSYRFTER